MPPLYVVEQGARLSVDRRTLLVEGADGLRIARVPLTQVSAVVVFGNVVLTTPAIKRLLAAGVDVVFLTQEGRYQGRLIGPLTRFGQLRQQQYERLSQRAARLSLAQQIVVGKCLNMRTLLQRYNRDLGRAEIAAAVQRLGTLAERARRAPHLNALRGVEGSASAAYFGVFGALLKRDWAFERRLRRPPPDPVNVLLSLGYTLLTRELEAAVAIVGLDPYIGALHDVQYGRPSLALDLMEEFRAIVVDSVVLRCLNNELVVPDDFSPGQTPDRPIVLSDRGKKAFLRAFEERVETTVRHPVTGEQMTYRRVFEIQTRLLARCLRDGVMNYRPFRVD
jgi:CRISPR-associated protein Cas1